MDTIEDLIAKYTEGNNTPAWYELFDPISIKGTAKEKEILADSYVEHFGQCHYDYMCGKFNDKEGIMALMEWVEKIKKLIPAFEQYYYYKGHVYEMLSSVSEPYEDKLKFKNLCITHFRKQKEVNDQDVTLLIDLAENLFQSCKLMENCQTSVMKEVKILFLEALHLERKEEHQHGFFGFNGSAISAFLNCSYELLTLPIEDKERWHQEFLKDFKDSIQQYTSTDPDIYYHWADTLERITEWINYPAMDKSSISPKQIEEIWEEMKDVLSNITAPQSDNEHFLTSVGHLFNKVAIKEKSAFYFEVSFDYYYKAFEINDETWTTPHYTSNALSNIALIHLKNNDLATAKALFERGLEIFERAQKKIDDFQLSVYHAGYLYDYAKYFENFSNKKTLLQAQELYEDSRVLGKDFYTHPYYGLAKVALRLGSKETSLEILKQCGEIFSNQYHIHDFDEIIDNEDFETVKEDITQIIAGLNKLK